VIIGIDLGTTFSAAGLVRKGLPTILPHGSERILPSVVGLSPDGTLLVGSPAHNQFVIHPELTIRSIKRKMGLTEKVTLGDQTYRPQDISALILREIKRGAEAQLGQTVTRAVITVPAYFSDAARQATYEAGQIAGFTVERIINEPTAAALAYGLNRSKDRQMVAVYDLGGGTFDVSIIELDSGVVEVRASHGNTRLGGDDFDQRLADHLAEVFFEQHGLDLRQNPRSQARLLRAAENAKIQLSSQPFVKIREEYLAEKGGIPLHLDLEFTRHEFEDLIGDLIEGTLVSVDSALQDAGLKASDLDRVLFVGGSTRIPLVWQQVQQHLKIAPEMAINPDEAVALGAGVQAAIIAGEPLDAILVDVTPHSLGIEVAEWHFGQLIPDRYSVILHRNTTIPTSRSEVYSAIHVDQKAIQIKVFQGEQTIASRNTLLDEFLFEDLQPEIPGQAPRVTVQFDFDLNGILQVSATDRGSQKQERKTVKVARTRLSTTDLAQVQANLGALEQKKPLSAADLENAGLLARAKQVLTSNKGPKMQALQAVATALETAMKHGEQSKVAQAQEDLIDLLYQLEED